MSLTQTSPGISSMPSSSMPKRVMIEDIIDGKALCRDQFGKLLEVTARVQRAKGLPIKVGERWLVDRTLGFWTFAAILDEQLGAPFDPRKLGAQEVFVEGWSQANGSEWNKNRWGSYGPGIAEVQGGQGVMRVTTAGYAGSAKNALSMARVLQSETLVTLTPPTSSEWSAKVAARAHEWGRPQSIEPAHSYFVEVSNTNCKLLKRYSHTQIIVANAAKPTKGPYRIRFRIEDEIAGIRIKAKVWYLGGSEPTTWGLEYLDTAHLDNADNDVSSPGTSGLLLFGGFNAATVEAKWDDLKVVVLGDPPRRTADFSIPLLQTGGVLSGDLSEPEFGNETVTTPKLGPKAVTREKIEPEAVGTSQVAPEAITTPLIAPEAITRSRIEEKERVPIGGIIMWTQLVIPVGWLRCDGSSTAGTALASIMATTPELRDRFIVGAGTYPLGSTGGASTVTLTTAQVPGHIHTLGSHSHPGISHLHSQPEHNHPPGGHVHGPIGGGEHLTTSGTGTNYGIASGDFYNFKGQGNTAAPSASGLTSPAGGENTGSASPSTGTTNIGDSGSAGGGGSHENKPPYYAMIFLIRAD